MRPLVTPEEMAAADKAAIDGGAPVEVLMDRAGRAVARTAIDMLGGRYGRKVAVVCGKGNNGGDGYAAARVLSRQGVGVVCLAVSDPSELQGAARHHYDRARRAGVRVTPFDESRLVKHDLVIDALFGTGFRGPADGAGAAAIAAVNRSGAPVLAVDIPSGVDGTTGAVEGPAVHAQVTVTMAAEKLGTAVGEGAARAGNVLVAGIGIAVRDAAAALVEASDVAHALPGRSLTMHKRSAGHVVAIAGSDAMTGAAALLVRGAYRAGGGYVSLVTTRGAAAVVRARCPEALVHVIPEGDHLDAGAVGDLESLIADAAVVAVGPGLGQGDDQRKLVERLLRDTQVPVVADADALNVLAGAPDALVERRAATVITPHPSELARLLGTDTETVQADRVGAARAAASRFGSVVLLKGFRSVIAAPDGPALVNPTGGPHLATAGTGDVLTGLVAALVAAGCAPLPATWSAAFLHGRAGDLAAQQRGAAGLVAWDVAEALPTAIASL